MNTRTLFPRLILCVNMAIVGLLVFYFFFIPSCLICLRLPDFTGVDASIPAEAWRLHRYLSPKYAEWVNKRIESGDAVDVHYLNVPDTEWPLFGSVFYLWATENLQRAWEKDHRLSAVAPAVYARETIEACKNLLLDPKHHTWVKTHWGDDYMHRENVFFRSLLIAGLTSYETLTQSGEVLPILRDQVESLSMDLDDSPYGVLHDYPNECYPIDVFAAVAWIKKADAVLGKDSSTFTEREKRAFTGKQLDKNGLVPWLMDPKSGKQYEDSRGIINSHVLIFAPDLYPDLATRWYDLFEKYFWQENWLAAGWREFYRDRPNSNWTFDVDSGPIILGFSPAANAFGLAAAKANGRLDHAYTLGTQILAASWPLLDGRLLGARIMSGISNSPYLGECGILWQLTVSPSESAVIRTGGHIGNFFYWALCFYLGVSLLFFVSIYLKIRKDFPSVPKKIFPKMNAQFATWCAFILVFLMSAILGWFIVSSVAFIVSQYFPFAKKGKAI